MISSLFRMALGLCVDGPNAPRETSTHDYREHLRGWGHDYVFSPVDGGKRARMTGWGHGMRNGDYIVMSNAASPNGETRYRIERIEYKREILGELPWKAA